MSGQEIDVEYELERILTMMMVDAEEKEEDAKLEGEESIKAHEKTMAKLRRLIKNGRLCLSIDEDKVIFRLKKAIIQGKSEINLIEFDANSLTAERFLKMPKKDKANDFEVGNAFVAAFTGLPVVTVGKLSSPDMLDLGLLGGFFMGG